VAALAEIRRVFVTGALGFIGHTIADRYRSRGVEVRGVDLSADLEHGVVAGDITRPGPWQEQMRGCDVVFHTAAIVSNAGGLERFWRLNVYGTRLALDAAATAGARRFVHFSTVRAFSDVDFPDGVDETYPVRTNGVPYVDTKVASEQVVLAAHAAGQLPCTVIRPGDAYGPGSRPWTVLPVQMIKSGRFMLPAMGRGVFSPVYVENLVDGVAAAAESVSGAGEVFIITDGIGITTREFFSHYYHMLGKPGPPVVSTRLALGLAAAIGRWERARGHDTEVNAASVMYMCRRGTYSIAKARSMLGYEPRISLAEGMARTEAWLRDTGLI